MQKRSWLLGGVLLTVALAVGAFLFFPGKAPAYDGASRIPTPIPSVPAPQEPEPLVPNVGGVPAIHHVGSGLVTEAEVRAFIAAHGFSGSAGGKTTAGTMPTITKVMLVTAKQAQGLLKGESANRADTAMVWYVELQGPFLLDIPMPAAAKPTPLHTGQELFDVTTGDLIMFGSMG